MFNIYIPSERMRKKKPSVCNTQVIGNCIQHNGKQPKKKNRVKSENGIESSMKSVKYCYVRCCFKALNCMQHILNERKRVQRKWCSRVYNKKLTNFQHQQYSDINTCCAKFTLNIIPRRHYQKGESEHNKIKWLKTSSDFSREFALNKCSVSICMLLHSLLHTLQCGVQHAFISRSLIYRSAFFAIALFAVFQQSIKLRSMRGKLLFRSFYFLPCLACAFACCVCIPVAFIATECINDVLGKCMLLNTTCT